MPSTNERNVNFPTLDEAGLDREMTRCADFLRQAGAQEIADRLLSAWRDNHAAGEELNALRGVPRSEGAVRLDAVSVRLETTSAAVDRALVEAGAWFAHADADDAADADMRRVFEDLAGHWRRLGDA
jgi:hypothetical protein